MDESADRPPREPGDGSEPGEHDDCPQGRDGASLDAGNELAGHELAGDDADLVDRDLLLDFQRGDREAFDRIVRRFEAPLWRFFYRLCWDRDRAEDFVQDVFLKVYKSAARYEPRGKLSTFLYRIATNRWIDHWRSARPRPTLFSLDARESDDDAAILESITAPSEEPSATLVGDHEKERLRRALDRLTMPHRLVFELAVYQNLPYPEISILLDIPVGTVKSRMHNTTRVLKELLTDEDTDESEDTQPQQGHHPPRRRFLRSRA